MCIHKRIVFDLCNHSQWSSTPLRECDVQKSFRAGLSVEQCNTARGHPLATVKVQGKCRKCQGRHEKVDDRLQRAKNLISQSKQTLIGADERCRAILEDAGIDVSDDEAVLKEVEKEIEGLERREAESEGHVETGKETNENAKAKRGGQVQEQGEDPATEFLKKRKEEKNASLFMA
jgi:hypothetical protein